MISTRKTFYTLLIFLFALPYFAAAHSPDQSYIYLRIYGDAMGGRFEATAKDMNRSIGTNLPNEFTMEDIQPHLSKIQEYFISKSSFRHSDREYKIAFTEPEVLELEEMDYFLRLHFDFIEVDEVPEHLDIKYEAFFDKDPNNSGVCIMEYNWKAGIVGDKALLSLIFGPASTEQQLSLKDASIWKGFYALVKLGIWHIWIGLDHILFIVALILPAVVRRKNDPHNTTDLLSVSPDYSNSWLPVAKFKPAFFYILKIITFFTIAHSITLALASLDIITLNSRFVESVIALSIALAALHNITPIIKSKEWIIAFGFGLFHGFGFASVLGEKGLSGDFMTLSLLGFNIGVELGQVLIICMIFPFLFLLRRYNIYPKIVKYGSFVLILISLYWCIERGFDVDLPAGKYFWIAYNSIFS